MPSGAPSLDSRAVDEVASALDADPELWTPSGRPSDASERVALTEVVPLATGCLAIGRVTDEIAVAPLVAEGGSVRRAAAGDGVLAAVARALVATVPGLAGRPAASRVDIDGDERSLGVHTN